MRAEVWDKAAHYLLRAGNEAFWRDAKTEAVRFLLRGLEAVAQSGQDGQDSSLGLQLRLELRNPLYQLARMDELADHLAAARPLALQLSDPIHTGRYHMFQSHYYWFAGDANAALREAEAAEALAASTGVEALALRGRFQRGLVCLSRAEHRETIAIMDAVSAAILTRRPQDAFGMNRTLLVTTLGYSARARAELGDISEARANAAQSLALARQVDNQFAWVFAYLAEGWVNFRAGDPERALPFLEHAYETCLNEEVPLMAPVASSLLAMALLHSGGCSPASNPADIKRALSLAERAVEQGEEFKFGAFQPLRLAILSQALSAAGRHDDALATAMVALERARIQFEPGSEIEALFAMAQAQSSLRMDWQEPLQHALSLAGRLQMTPALAHCKKLQALCAERSPNS
jgi:tetratricopeptide (TPR) repeat protein